MKKFLFIILFSISTFCYSQVAENADICFIWLNDLKPYQTFEMEMTEDETVVYKEISKKFPNQQNPNLFVQGICTSLNSDGKPIYVVVYTAGKKGYENVNILEYSEFIEFTED